MEPSPHTCTMKTMRIILEDMNGGLWGKLRRGIQRSHSLVKNKQKTILNVVQPGKPCTNTLSDAHSIPNCILFCFYNRSAMGLSRMGWKWWKLALWFPWYHCLVCGVMDSWGQAVPWLGYWLCRGKCISYIPLHLIYFYFFLCPCS